MTIASNTSLGPVELTVGDLDRLTAYYRDAIGLRELRHDGNRVELGAAGGDEPLVVLVAQPAAPPRPPRTTGLFHLALLVPSRSELARSLNRVAAAGHRLTGAADHLVSEALYLDDPEGNGIEIYRDRPAAEWQYEDDQLQMGTLPLDLHGVLATIPAGDAGDGMAADTRIGHVHLQVASLPAAEAFYVGALGFEVMIRAYPGALFVSAGGYHHHVGLNTWAGEGAPPPPPGSRGLRSLTVELPDERALDDTLQALAAGGIALAPDAAGAVVVDPSSNRILLRRRG